MESIELPNTNGQHYTKLVPSQLRLILFPALLYLLFPALLDKNSNTFRASIFS